MKSIQYISNSSSNEYRFGFNGKEKDKETYGEGNEYDFGARIYNPRIGRWLGVDPLDSKYPSFSPYSFAANNPIFYIDPDGKKIEGVTIDKDGSYKFSKAALKNGTDKYVLARTQTNTGTEKINALIAEKKTTYKIAVTNKVILMPTANGRYGIAGGGSDSHSNSIVVGLNQAKFNTVTDKDLGDAVTIGDNGRLVPISIKRNQLDNPLEDPNNEHTQANEKAYEESGAKAMDDNKDTKLKTEEQTIHAFGAHEETHLTPDNIELQNKGNVYNVEKPAYDEEVKERKEYNDKKQKSK